MPDVIEEVLAFPTPKPADRTVPKLFVNAEPGAIPPAAGESSAGPGRTRPR